MRPTPQPFIVSGMDSTTPPPERSAWSSNSPVDCIGEVPVRIEHGVAWLRPLGRDEIGPLHAVFEAMSPTSRHGRYLNALSMLSADMTRLLVAVDGVDHVAWLASVDERPAGIARYVRVDPTAAEIAFEVADEFHGRGLGAVLVDTVTTIAAASGVTTLRAYVLGANQPSRRLLSRLGLELSRIGGGELEAAGAFHLFEQPRIDRAAVLRLARCPQPVG